MNTKRKIQKRENSDENITLINVKLDPEQVAELIRAFPNKFIPAFHMNKTHWVSVKIENIDRVELKRLLDESIANTVK